MSAVEGDGRLASVTGLEPGQLLAIAAVVSALLFGMAGLIGAVGYLVSVTRNR